MENQKCNCEDNKCFDRASEHFKVFISKLLTSKSELMEGNKKFENQLKGLDGLVKNPNECKTGFDGGFNAGISKAIEILKK